MVSCDAVFLIGWIAKLHSMLCHTDALSPGPLIPLCASETRMLWKKPAATVSAQGFPASFVLLALDLTLGEALVENLARGTEVSP